jgi:hypothetical protein
MKRRFHSWLTTDNGRSTLFKCACIAILFGGVALFSAALATTDNPFAIVRPIPPLLEEEIDLVDSGTYVYGKYKYVYDRANRFEGPTGYLFILGKPVLAMVRNEKVDTPWGIMYWHGVHDHRALPEGWMPYPDYRAPLESFDF